MPSADPPSPKVSRQRERLSCLNRSYGSIATVHDDPWRGIADKAFWLQPSKKVAEHWDADGNRIEQP